MQRRLTSYWVDRRRYCRRVFSTYVIMWSVFLVTLPFMVIGDNATPVEHGIFGLDPNLVKGAFIILALGFSGLLVRVAVKIDNNQTTLFDNQRKLAQTLAALVTAHNIRHAGEVEMPELSDGGK